MSRIVNISFTVFCVVTIGGAIIWSFRVHRAQLAAEAQSDEPIANAARVIQTGGEIVVKFDRETQKRIGIRAEAAATVTKRREVAAYGRLEEDPSRSFILRAPVAGTVQTEQPWPNIGQNVGDRSVVGVVDPRLPPTDQITLTDRLAAVKADIESGRAALSSAQAALDRARMLNADNKNVSDRAVQEAETRVAAEQARLSSARESASLIESSLQSTHAEAAPLELARGGQVVEVLVHPGESVESGQPILRVTRFDQLLARVDVPAGEIIAADVASATIAPLGDEEHPIRGEPIALAETVDPRTQGQPFLFRIANPSVALRPGLSVTAFLAVPGPARSGVVVPRSAVVRQSGRTWVYVQTAEDQFARRPVILEEPAGSGRFTRSLSTGDRVVTVGAQALLSEEFKSQIQGSEESQ